jgi:hypothetical protein
MYLCICIRVVLYCHAVWTLYLLFSQNLKLKYMLYIIVRFGFPLMEEQRFIVFESKILLKKIFEPKRNEVTREWKKYIIRSFIICTLHQILSARSSQLGQDGQDMWYALERCYMHTNLSENLCRVDHLGNLDVEKIIMLKWIFSEMWGHGFDSTGIRVWHKFWLAEWLLVSQGGLCCFELVNGMVTSARCN